MPHFCEALHHLGPLDRLKEGTYEENKKVQENLQIPERNEIISQGKSEDQNLNKEIENEDSLYLVSKLTTTYLLESFPFSQQHYPAQRLRNVELWTRLPQIMRKGPDILKKGLFSGK